MIIAMNSFLRILTIIFVLSLLFAEETKEKSSIHSDPFRYSSAGKIGDNPFPTNPMNDRAIGYLLQGKAQTAISNYGNIINWDEHPMGIWNGFSYLPSVAFLAGVPGRLLTIDVPFQCIKSWLVLFHPRSLIQIHQ